ncbi:SusC/RagA family TonB-linked outer membrane protein [Sphingobacterium sp. CZ-UAM]|uniref:SusC/RagA family TonB-linked outer membrane protein n=1 Tax=Sphingobacterium sp. CZ-UAM TaxID=1933868 RepID=UPI00158EDA43|nr:SusC/RagA family TonB-linked outer membrane protein [Sphingobacterium sp. CZ-UAM]
MVNLKLLSGRYFTIAYCFLGITVPTIVKAYSNNNVATPSNTKLSYRKSASKPIFTKVLFQQTNISGVVMDKEGRPLQGVSIREIGTNNGTVTDSKGKFALKLKNLSAKISFNLIGYVPQELTSNKEMRVSMQQTANSLDEVIVTGFQKINKEKFTGSVSTIDKKTIDRSGYVDVSKMLQGAAAGVSVQSVSGTMGTSAKIRIRGNASISANQEPLFVINGIPISSPANLSVSQLYSGDVAAVLGSAIAGLNAQDIEDIVILKDGAATSLYGTRAANGVISITTKSGKANENNINYSSALTYGLKPNINQFNLMNSGQEMNMYRRLWNAGYYSNEVWPLETGAYTEPYRKYGLREIDLNEAYAELEKATTVNTDWFDVLFQNNLMQEHNLSFSGGGEKNTYYVSGNYTKDNGQAKGYGFDRYTLDFRDVLKIGTWLSLDFNANYAFRQQLTPGTLNSGISYGAVTRSFEINPALYAINTSRTLYPYNDDGSPKHYIRNLAPFNILEELNENFATVEAQDFRFMVKPTIKITNNLTYEFTGALRRTVNNYNHTVTEKSNYANAHRVDYNDALRGKNDLLWQDPNDPNAIKSSILSDGGILITNNDRGKFYNIRSQFTFDKEWGNHHLNSVIGSDIRNDYFDYTKNTNYGYLYYSGKTTNPSTLAYLRAILTDSKLFNTSFRQENVVGFYTSHQYSYKNRYNIEGGARFDGSNMFGKNVRSKYLPNYSIGVSWNVDKEPFFQALNKNQLFDFLKIRSSYALRGNTFQISPQLNALPVNLNKIDRVNSTSGIRVNSPELYALNWERDYVANVGLDIGMFKKLNLTLEYYYRKNKDLIAPFNTAQEEGFETKLINWASMTNKGIDINLSYQDILNSPDFKWGVNLIYGYVKNTVVEGIQQSLNLTEITRPNGYGMEGKPLEGLYAYRFAKLNSLGRPMFYRGDNVVDGIISSDRDVSLIQYMGPRSPTSTGSFATNLAYKGFDLRFFLTFAAGHKVFKNGIAKRFYDDASSKSADLNYMWLTPGNEELTNIPGLISTVHQSYLGTMANIDELAYNRSTERVVDASHIRLSEVMLSYDIMPALHSIKKIKSARIALSANNLTFWGSPRLRGVDPDVFITGVNLPNPRSFSLRLSIGL